MNQYHCDMIEIMQACMNSPSNTTSHNAIRTQSMMWSSLLIVSPIRKVRSLIKDLTISVFSHDEIVRLVCELCGIALTYSTKPREWKFQSGPMVEADYLTDYFTLILHLESLLPLDCVFIPFLFNLLKPELFIAIFSSLISNVMNNDPQLSQELFTLMKLLYVFTVRSESFVVNLLQCSELKKYICAVPLTINNKPKEQELVKDYIADNIQLMDHLLRNYTALLDYYIDACLPNISWYFENLLILLLLLSKVPVMYLELVRTLYRVSQPLSSASKILQYTEALFITILKVFADIKPTPYLSIMQMLLTSFDTQRPMLVHFTFFHSSQGQLCMSISGVI